MPRGKVEAKADAWRERVRRWKESGLSAREFAAREGIERHGALSWWAYHLSQRDAVQGSTGRKSTPGDLRIVELSRPAERTRPASPVEIMMPSGVRLMVSADSDEAALQRALQALGVRS